MGLFLNGGNFIPEDTTDFFMNELLVDKLGPVAGGYFGDVFFNLGEKRGYKKRDFSPDALDMVKEMVSLSRKEGQTEGSVNPKDFRGLFQPQDGFLSKHVTSPYAEVMNAIGKFSWKTDKDGQLTIGDRGYDWENTLAEEPWWDTTGSTSTSGGRIKQLAKKIAYHTTGTKQGQGKGYEINLGGLFDPTKQNKKGQ
jgi:hypothetical protein